MKKMDDSSKQVLNLYEIHEVEQKEKAKKNRTLPMILMLIGILFIAGGFFYKDIVQFLSNKNNETKKEETVIDNDKLKCNYKKDDATLGITYTYNNSYTFKDKLLKSSETVITISPLPNSDIAADNIKVLSGKYSDVLTSLNATNGIDTSNTLKNNILTIKYSVDYTQADLTKVLKNDKIVIDHTLDESYASVKRKNQESNYLCQ